MNLKQVKEIARSKGVEPGSMKKEDLIRAIQRHEGNFDCFGTAGSDCSRQDCLWRKDCLGRA